MLWSELDSAGSELDRGIMHFEGATSLAAMTISSLLVLGAILLLLWWSIQAAYPWT